MYHDSRLSNEAGLAELKAYLKSARGRKETLAQNWPLSIARIAKRAEFEQPLPGTLPHAKGCGQELSDAEKKEVKDSGIFTSISAQFRALAEELKDHVETPSLPDDLFWYHSTVKPGETQFIGWHTDGHVWTREDGELVSKNPEQTLKLLAAGHDFTPQHIYLQATFELPSRFLAAVRGEFGEGIVQSVRAGRGYSAVVNAKRLEDWAAENASFNSAAPGDIAAFPSGAMHTGVTADRMCQRTIVVLRLKLKHSENRL